MQACQPLCATSDIRQSRWQRVGAKNCLESGTFFQLWPDLLAIAVPALHLKIQWAKKQHNSLFGIVGRRIEQDRRRGLVFDSGEINEILIRTPLADQRGRAFACENDAGGTI